MSEPSEHQQENARRLARLLEHGQTATLSLSDRPRDIRYRTLVCGWKEGHFVVLDVPETEGRKLALREGEGCVLRLVSGGVAHACISNVLECATGPKLSYVFLHWPREVQSMAVRRHERHPVGCACRLVTEEYALDGWLVDLSPGGCRAELSADPGHLREARIESALPGGWVLSGRVVVRSKIDSAGAFQLGCQFGEGESALEEAATEFVSAQISASRFGADRPDLVLVAGPDRGAAEEFTKQLEESGCGVVSARTGLECAARAQSLPMAAVVVHASLQDISALELARALRTSSWLQEVPILVYGPGLNADQCRQAGNADYLGERLSRQDASALLERLSR